MISVCVATYNGEKFIRKQLESILPQLSDVDEIIVSDDSSNDKTMEVVESFKDKRIKILKGNNFRSPIYNFENCISHAVGSIIVLSDQDDLWLPGKISAIQTVFRDNPEVTLVASDAKIVNGKGDVIRNTFYPGDVKFSSKVLHTIIKNHFLGCTLAFRSSVLGVVLPFPAHLPMHDSWIGIMNQIYGRVHFIETPLVAYRRHSQNFSSSTHASIYQMIKWRLWLVCAVLGRMWKCGFWKRTL